MSRRGHDRERQVKARLEDEDWMVTRAAGSLGCADLVALKDGKKPLLVEVKSTITPYSHFLPADRERLLRTAELAGANATLAWWPSRGQLLWIDPSAWPKGKTSPEETCPECGGTREAPDEIYRPPNRLMHPPRAAKNLRCIADFHRVAA